MTPQSLKSLGVASALWNDSLAYEVGDVVTYNDSDWVTTESSNPVAQEELIRMVGELFKRQVGEEVARKFKVTSTTKGVAIDTTHESGAPAPELPTRKLAHTEQVFPFEEV